MTAQLQSVNRKAPGDLRRTVRGRTRAAHDRVDAAFSRFDLRIREDYAAFLAANAAVVPAVEAALAAGGVHALVDDWPDRLRTPALMFDLQKLGIDPPPALPAPALRSEAEVLGALYVVEGSRLGARLLLGRARSSPDPMLRGATAYLAHGEGHRFWPALLQVLDGYRGDPEAVADGAQTAFELFARAAR